MRPIVLLSVLALGGGACVTAGDAGSSPTAVPLEVVLDQVALFVAGAVAPSSADDLFTPTPDWGAAPSILDAPPGMPAQAAMATMAEITVDASTRLGEIDFGGDGLQLCAQSDGLGVVATIVGRTRHTVLEGIWSPRTGRVFLTRHTAAPSATKVEGRCVRYGAGPVRDGKPVVLPPRGQRSAGIHAADLGALIAASARLAETPLSPSSGVLDALADPADEGDGFSPWIVAQTLGTAFERRADAHVAAPDEAWLVGPVDPHRAVEVRVRHRGAGKAMRLIWLRRGVDGYALVDVPFLVRNEAPAAEDVVFDKKGPDWVRQVRDPCVVARDRAQYWARALYVAEEAWRAENDVYVAVDTLKLPIPPDVVIAVNLADPQTLRARVTVAGNEVVVDGGPPFDVVVDACAGP